MNMEEGTIVNWNFTEGESFKTGDVLYEVETEKVTNEAEVPRTEPCWKSWSAKAKSRLSVRMSVSLKARDYKKLHREHPK